MLTPDTPTTSWTGLPDLRPLVVGYLGRFLRDDAEIEDVAQEALLRAARFRPHLADPTRLRAWVLRIALNVVRDRRRRESRIPRADVDEALLLGIEGREEIPGDPHAEAWIELAGVSVERAAAFEHLDAAVAGLDAADRGALVGWYFEPPARGAAGSVRDAGRVAPRKHHVFRARRRLTRALIRRFALDADVAWPAIDGAWMEPGPAEGARCARARSGTWP